MLLLDSEKSQCRKQVGSFLSSTSLYAALETFLNDDASIGRPGWELKLTWETFASPVVSPKTECLLCVLFAWIGDVNNSNLIKPFHQVHDNPKSQAYTMVNAYRDVCFTYILKNKFTSSNPGNPYEEIMRTILSTLFRWLFASRAI